MQEKKRFVNLTPHNVNIMRGDQGNLIVPPSGLVSRVMKNLVKDKVNGVEVVSFNYGEIKGLPTPQAGVIYIVSDMVAQAAKRPDVMSPWGLQKDEKGSVVSCLGLACYATN